MARLLVRTILNKRGDITAVVPNDHAFGSGEDARVHRAVHGNLDRWHGRFVVIDLPDMSMTEAKRLCAPVVTVVDGPLDPDTGEPTTIPTIHHNSLARIDYEGMADTADRQRELGDDYHVERNTADVTDKIIEREPVR